MIIDSSEFHFPTVFGGIFIPHIKDTKFPTIYQSICYKVFNNLRLSLRIRHTAQGLEFDYVGVLIGKDLTYDPLSGQVRTNKEAISRDDKSSGIRGASDELARRLILNTYKTLLTRGQKGCFVYCEDEALREYFKRMVTNSL